MNITAQNTYKLLTPRKTPNFLDENDNAWNNVHSYYVASQFFGANDEFVEKLRIQKGPAQITRLIKAYRGDADENWNKLVAIEKAYRFLFEQHDDLRQLLISTGDKPLFYIDKDTVWGVKSRKAGGQNELGKILMRIRTEYTGTKTKSGKRQADIAEITENDLPLPSIIDNPILYPNLDVNTFVIYKDTVLEIVDKTDEVYLASSETVSYKIPRLATGIQVLYPDLKPRTQFMIGNAKYTVKKIEGMNYIVQYISGEELKVKRAADETADEADEGDESDEGAVNVTEVTEEDKIKNIFETDEEKLRFTLNITEKERAINRFNPKIIPLFSKKDKHLLQVYSKVDPRNNKLILQNSPEFRTLFYYGDRKVGDLVSLNLDQVARTGIIQNRLGNESSTELGQGSGYFIIKIEGRLFKVPFITFLEFIKQTQVINVKPGQKVQFHRPTKNGFISSIGKFIGKTEDGRFEVEYTIPKEEIVKMAKRAGSSTETETEIDEIFKTEIYIVDDIQLYTSEPVVIQIRKFKGNFKFVNGAIVQEEEPLEAVIADESDDLYVPPGTVTDLEFKPKKRRIPDGWGELCAQFGIPTSAMRLSEIQTQHAVMNYATGEIEKQVRTPTAPKEDIFEDVLVTGKYGQTILKAELTEVKGLYDVSMYIRPVRSTRPVFATPKVLAGEPAKITTKLLFNLLSADSLETFGVESAYIIKSLGKAVRKAAKTINSTDEINNILSSLDLFGFPSFLEQYDIPEESLESYLTVVRKRLRNFLTNRVPSKMNKFVRPNPEEYYTQSINKNIRRLVKSKYYDIFLKLYPGMTGKPSIEFIKRYIKLAEPKLNKQSLKEYIEACKLQDTTLTDKELKEAQKEYIHRNYENVLRAKFKEHIRNLGYPENISETGYQILSEIDEYEQTVFDQSKIILQYLWKLTFPLTFIRDRDNKLERFVKSRNTCPKRAEANDFEMGVPIESGSRINRSQLSIHKDTLFSSNPKDYAFIFNAQLRAGQVSPKEFLDGTFILYFPELAMVVQNIEQPIWEMIVEAINIFQKYEMDSILNTHIFATNLIKTKYVPPPKPNFQFKWIDILNICYSENLSKVVIMEYENDFEGKGYDCVYLNDLIKAVAMGDNVDTNSMLEISPKCIERLHERYPNEIERVRKLLKK